MSKEQTRYAQAIDEVARTLVAGHLAEDAQLRGCSEAELQQFEAALGVNLPGAYRAFLARMGKEAGTFMEGSGFLADELLTTTQAVRKLAADAPEYGIPSGAVGFCEHQGYQVLFFEPSAGDDPPVFHWIEDEPARRVADRFTDWLRSAVDDEVMLERELAPGRSRPR